MAHACPYTVTVGAYLLGALCAQENDEFRQHAKVCPDCEREIAELTPTARCWRHSRPRHTQPADTPAERIRTGGGWLGHHQARRSARAHIDTRRNVRDEYRHGAERGDVYYWRGGCCVGGL
ncbi:hypothetical protein DMH04_52285 [Kibdelosporangium aridum]|uniref:Uncharacterized protein n=1 Tax=Kibdelosporangium aridum TaxID=2030 RepID=A0A428Y8K4_KIBAR|nr:hypothetical protein DMH04_52285 [Kibdelosporangium aridum]